MLPRPNPRVVYQAMPDGAVLFSPENEVYFGLNDTGACIWENLPPTQQSVAALCDAVRTRFPDADPATVSSDVQGLLAELLENGLVVAPE